MEETEKKSRGGRRPGAGRPPSENRKVTISVSISRDAYDFLIHKKNKSEYIDRLLRAVVPR